ncbi:HNH endonuclease signature motif containing protein [Candidatus Parabeggiatoa sp. HSG14]|uniref:HNH endonuclease n=1 Tax=Candidatus Parabeggiatoa sp. HSG14 TaxID=3055593 RepID=UPI0025A70D50|nr:HNH endonuclease signature motif containing protein [Thiotrichales bacterium HSG14]
MSRSYISVELRRLVVNRAQQLCEYCLIHENDTFYGCQVDHIISEKHGGLTLAENLAYACTFCNRCKGSDVGSIVLHSGEFSRFFNPRIDQWADHFMLDGAMIVALTDIGRVTAKILDFNNAERLLERQTLQKMGNYPCAAALKRMIV